MPYYEVLPLKKTGLSDRAFTYQTIESIALGVVVTVPLKNRKVRGIVTRAVKKPEFKTKLIEKVLTNEPVLDDNHLKLAQKISSYYLSSLGETINAFLPFELGKKRRIVSDKGPVINDQETPHQLTKVQKEIYKNIKEAKNATKHLIHGVTGSGKTEIYLQLVAEALKNNLGSIMLVPEISLTPQTQERFEKRFPGKVAVWHSHLKETEKYRFWSEIQSGKKPIVLGARSAIFMPIRKLAYIIIDEEHENSYKQDKNPKYETARVAEWLADLTGAKLILGSATPKLESFYKSQNNEYFYYSMNNRIVQKNLPPVYVVDMRDEFRKGNKSIFSDTLVSEINKVLTKNKQVLLFVNRRGASTFIVCRDCGSVEKCPRCEIPLIYHPSASEALLCHHCEYKKNIPTICPNCKSYAIKYFGLGTQKVEIEVRGLFPKARVMRMDRDTTKQRGSHEEIYKAFKNKDYDILIGTQVIAKGWDIPGVDLVGVIAADTTLNIPDFQGSEKTFALLTQVAGRTGRSDNQGKVIIQTYSPENYAIRSAKNHDYLNFYETEISSRKNYKYPPFSSFIKLTLRLKNELIAEKKAQLLAKTLKSQLLGENIAIAGPIPAFIYKKGGYSNWQIIIKVTTDYKNITAKKEEEIISINNKLKKILPPEWNVDVNPSSLL